MSVSPFVNKAACVSQANNAVGTTDPRSNGPRWTALRLANGRFSRTNELRVLCNFATKCTSKRACPSGHVTLRPVSQMMWSGFGGLEVACWPLVPKWSRGSVLAFGTQVV